jgi:hypothetical protein
VRGDSYLHTDGNHGILAVLKGTRVAYVHAPNVNDLERRCQLDTTGADGHNQVPEDKMKEIYHDHEFVRFVAQPGDLTIQERFFMTACFIGDVIFLNRTRPHRFISEPGSIAISICAAFRPSIETPSVYWSDAR